MWFVYMYKCHTISNNYIQILERNNYAYAKLIEHEISEYKWAAASWIHVHKNDLYYFLHYEFLHTYNNRWRHEYFIENIFRNETKISKCLEI